ncbi:MAG: nicotinate phosphoribosyltransferase [Chloroflexota bacterium]|nr:nicotinate phosphoribosyltransferase [Chloroflexota bacterium]MDE2918624.1 nicotinate phosphoribosyltransferase [Chloroflexota bacterium]
MTPRAQPSAPADALLTDLYQLSMLQAYWEHGLTEPATFDLFCRRLPPNRNLLIACGLEGALDYLEGLAVTAADLEYLASLNRFSRDFLNRLERLRFRGDVRAVPEGTPVFGNEPILEVTASLPEAQVVETYLLSAIHHQTMAASAAHRLVAAADGLPVVDFGTRHAQGAAAGVDTARAAYIAGAAGTSNVAAGRRYGIPVSGTMAHSYIQAHEGESEALASFTETHRGTTVLVDTYDTRRGVQKVIDLAVLQGDEFDVAAIRIDSGNLDANARLARGMLDTAGLDSVRIIVSGELDAGAIDALVTARAPIDGFGVGTALAVSPDAPYLDTAYKLAAYAGQGRMKLAAAKRTWPGRKQIFRETRDGVAVRDVLGRADESRDGQPLLRPAMANGRRIGEQCPSLENSRTYSAEATGQLPARVRGLAPATPPYPVAVSPRLQAASDRLARRLQDET